ncbi:TolC family protein [Deferribacterales bacterium RsTz2092]|nr:transporter [Deferribacterales bacterium]
MKKFLSALMLLLIGNFATENTAMAITIEEAIELTLNNDESIKRQRSLLDSQFYTSLTSGAAFLPTLDVSAGYTKSKLSDKEKRDTGFDGTEVTSSTASIALGYNLFNGFADVNNLRISKSSYSAQKYQYLANKQDIMLGIKKAYISYLQANDQANVASETVKLLEAQKNTASVSYRVGQFSRADVLKVDVQLASSRLDLMNAQISLKIAKQQLEKYIGRTIEAAEVVKDLELAEYNIPTLEELYKQLEDKRSELQATKMAYSIANATATQAFSTFLPQVNAQAARTWYGDENNPMDGRQGSYDAATSVGLTATWNLFRGFANANQEIAKAKTAQAGAHSVNDTRNALKLALSSAYENYFSAKEMLSVAKLGVEQAEESYRVTQMQYTQSEATTTDLLDANVALNRARISLANAKYGIISAVANIERAVESNFLDLQYTDNDSVK